MIITVRISFSGSDSLQPENSCQTVLFSKKHPYGRIGHWGPDCYERVRKSHVALVISNQQAAIKAPLAKNRLRQLVMATRKFRVP